MDLRRSSSEPTVRAGRVYLATADTGSEPFPQEMHVRALDFPSAHPIESPVRLALSDGSVIAGEDDWPSSPAVESGSTVVQLRGTSGLFAVGLAVRDKATLAPLWRAGLPVISFPASPPAVVDGQIFVVSGPFLLAFPANGWGAMTCAPVWTAGGVRSVAGGPLVAGGVVHASAPGDLGTARTARAG